jgi:Vitamin K-dependent gamma-carboxylase
MITLEQIASAWNSFFFDPIPVYSIALFRIIFGCILLYETFFILANLKEYLGPNGLIRYSSYFKKSRGRALSLFLYLPGTMLSVYIIMGLHLVAVTCMTIGLFTPLSTLLTYITVRSIVNRNPAICNGGDNVAKIMCFLLIFAPSGHAYSLDEILFFAPYMPGKEYLSFAPWVLRLMQIQISLIYLYTAYWKLRGPTYRAGSAIYYATSNDAYRRFTTPKIFVRPPLVKFVTWSTLFFEGFLGIGLWIKEFRVTLVALGIAFHLAIEYTLSVHLFGWYMIACLLLFIDPSYIQGLLQ